MDYLLNKKHGMLHLNLVIAVIDIYKIRNSVNQKVSCGQEVSIADISQQSWDKHYLRISVNGVMGEYMLFVIKEGIYLWDSDQHKSLYGVHWDTIY